MDLRKEASMTWDESEHPRDEIGRFAFKNGGENEEENKKEKKGDNNKKQKEGKKQNISSDKVLFKLGAEYNDVRTHTPTEALYGASSQTVKDTLNQKERNKLLNKLGNKLTTAQVLYSSVDDLMQIDSNIQKQSLNSNQNFLATT
jgi:hypothetical protein